MAARRHRKTVKQAIAEIRAFYEIGRRTLRDFPDHFSGGKGKSLAASLGISLDHLEKSRLFAQEYSRHELNELCRQIEKSDFAPGVQHVVRLMRLPSSRRWKFLRQTIEEKMSCRQLASAIHQTCLSHLLRRCRELLEHATRGAVIFPRKVKAILQESLEVRDLRDAKQITAQAAAAKADELETRVIQLVTPVKTHAANERFCRHLLRHASQLFTFLRHPGIDATNHRAEQAIRPTVVNRKVWGGNRTQAGAVAQSILMTALFTAARQGQDAVEFVGQVLRSLPEQRPLLLAGSG
ncbi:MAG: transposase [Tepidisphaeraceae bacterium]